MAHRALLPAGTAIAKRQFHNMVTSSSANVKIARGSRSASFVTTHPMLSSANNHLSFSTMPPPSPGPNKKSSWNPLTGMWNNYQDSSTKKKFKEQMEDISSVEQWTLGAYYDQLAKTATSWKSSLPGVRGTSEVKGAKESYEMMKGIIDVIGRDADLEDVYAMGRKEKLKAANNAEVTVARIEQELRMFETTTQTHMLLMEIKKNGTPLPETPGDLRQLMQIHARKIATKGDKERMEKMMKRQMMKSMGRHVRRSN